MLQKHLLSKSTFIRGKQCLKSLYLYKNNFRERDKPDPETLKRFDRGHQFGALALELFPGGVDLSPKSHFQYRQAVQTTRDVLRTNAYNTLYEAGFQSERLLIFVDILSRKDGSWKAYEVKSSYRISDTYLLDAAFQYFVIKSHGLPLEDFLIIYASEQVDYDNMGDYEDLKSLFTIESVLEKILPLQEYVRELVEKEKQTLLQKKMPAIGMGDHCNIPYPCDFQGFCTRNPIAESPLK
jgi:hypothetical protein